MAPHDPGVYLMVTTQEGQKMIAIDRTGSNRAHTSNVWERRFHMGLARCNARFRAKPEFYMYFPPTETSGSRNN